MKTRFLLAALLLLAFGSMRAQETLIPTPDGDGSKINTLVISGTGNVYLKQGDKLTLNDYGHHTARYRVEDSVLYLDGAQNPREVTVQKLEYLKISGPVGVRSKDKLKGNNLSVMKGGTGELNLTVDYNDVYVRSQGTGNVKLSGDCYVFCGEGQSVGKLSTYDLNYVVKVERSGDQWNMAFNTDEELNDLRKDFLKNMVKNAQPFFETESNRLWDFSSNDKTHNGLSSKTEFDELMRELGMNMERLSDSVDWKSFEEDMEKWEKDMEEWGRRMEEWGKNIEDKYGKVYEYHYEYNSNRSSSSDCETCETNKGSKRSLLFDANWNGFEAGLNMLFNPKITDVNYVDGSSGDINLAIRPLRSWYFGFNIADVGVAFNRKHTVGLFTGVGIGWNNFSWKNPVYTEDDPQMGGITNTLLPDTVSVKNSKLGLLYLQIPMMVEIRPTRHMYIDLGVTGGLRFASWSKVKYADGRTNKESLLDNPFINRFKLDAAFRIGGDNIGFFANYALLPIYRYGVVKNTHPLSFGFSINF